MFLFHFGKLKSQNGTFDVTKIEVKKIGVFNPKAIKPAFKAKIVSLEAPVPGGTSYRSALLELKKEAGKRTPRRSGMLKSDEGELDEAIPLNGFSMRRLGKYPVNGELKDTVLNVSGGIPLDNTLAISNDNYLMCGVNSKLYMHDLNQGLEPTDSNIFVQDFADFASGTSSPFDPKLLYDSENDRFIATFLTGRSPSTSGIILAFSTTNNPAKDPWNVYRVSGNPLNNDTWTDYPAIAMTEDELFYTVNLLVPGGDWKLTFSSTIIWQFDKESGYNGDTILKTNLWSDISMDGRNLRNLAPVQGGDSLQGPNMYFLSNRNFDYSNDSIFIVEVTGKIDDPDATLVVSVVKADKPYGLPPNGRQANSDPNDPSDGFDTNDARVLGSFKVGDDIQFVANTIDFSPGRGHAAVYHGIIRNVSNNPSISANTIGHDSLDFGYPNIVYTGTSNCESSALIAFNHTSPTHFSGVSMVKSLDTNYSALTPLKKGYGYVDRIPGSYERWGDYFGLQRKYNEPGVVWSAGFFGLENLGSATWINEIRDCYCFDALVSEIPLSDLNECVGYLQAEVIQGIEPFNFLWNLGATADRYKVNLCDYQYSLTVSDDKLCQTTITGKSEKSLPTNNNTVYPNPAYGDVNVGFSLSEAGTIEVIIYSVDGKVVSKVVDSQQANAGKNLLTFSISPLSAGTYILKINSNGNEVYSEKLIVL